MKDIAARVELYGLHGAYHHAKSERSQLKKIKREKKRKNPPTLEFLPSMTSHPKRLTNYHYTDSLDCDMLLRLKHPHSHRLAQLIEHQTEKPGTTLTGV